MPAPTSAPLSPPTAAPTAAPLRAAMIGPAAMKGPRPGIARAPMPASQPSAPPTTAPALPPVVAPSGALLAPSCPRSRRPVVSGNSTEMSSCEKPAARRSLTTASACWSLFTIQNTDFFILVSSRLRDVELIHNVSRPCRLLRQPNDRLAPAPAVHGAAERDAAVLGDDLYVLCVGRERVVGHQGLPDARRQLHVGGAVRLIRRRGRLPVTISRVGRRVRRRRAGAVPAPRHGDGGGEKQCAKRQRRGDGMSGHGVAPHARGCWSKKSLTSRCASSFARP